MLIIMLVNKSKPFDYENIFQEKLLFETYI